VSEATKKSSDVVIFHFEAEGYSESPFSPRELDTAPIALNKVRLSARRVNKLNTK
jgi:hypothetical protein